MDKLMNDVGKPIKGKTTRQAFVNFRSKVASDKRYFKIEHEEGCSASVRHYFDTSHV
jgi:hypothetical protein